MEDLVRNLMDRRSRHRFPIGIRPATEQFAQCALAVLFPHFAGSTKCAESEAKAELAGVRRQLISLGEQLGAGSEVPSEATADKFLQELETIYDALTLDARAIVHGDPAATSIDEVILTYPGFYAIAIYRIAHELDRLGYRLLPRLLTEYAHRETGIDIHPRASIGRSFFIDHGTGVVIGETAIIGNGVKLYQGVTLGALVVEKALADHQRHPTLGDHVVVYANATILGGSTVIGHDSVVGGNAWIAESVPPFSVVGRLSEVRPRRPAGDGDIEFNI